MISSSSSLRITPSRLRITLWITVLTAAALALSAPPANAGVLVDTATNCNSYNLEQPFLRWADSFDYQLAPDGTFERRARGWKLDGGARVVRGNESYYVHGRGESQSLSLRSGSSATSPAMCVGVTHFTLRMFALNRRSPASSLKVEVLFESDLFGNVESLPVALLNASRSWEPTIPMPLVVNLLPLLPDNRTAVEFRFTPQGAAGDWRIDDVYVDPYKSR